MANLTKEEQARYEHLKNTVEQHDGPWTSALEKEDREEYTALRKKMKAPDTQVSAEYVLDMLDDLYRQILDGDYRALLLAKKKEVQSLR